MQREAQHTHVSSVEMASPQRNNFLSDGEQIVSINSSTNAISSHSEILDPLYQKGKFRILLKRGLVK